MWSERGPGVRGASRVAALGLLAAVASLAAEHGLRGSWAQESLLRSGGPGAELLRDMQDLPDLSFCC